MGNPTSFPPEIGAHRIPQPPQIGAHRAQPSPQQSSTSQIALKSFAEETRSDTFPKISVSKRKILWQASKPLRDAIDPQLRIMGNTLRKMEPLLQKILSPFAKSNAPKEKLSPEEKNIASANQLIELLNEKDLQTEGIFRLAGNHEQLRKAESNLAKNILPSADAPTHLKANLLSRTIAKIDFFQTNENIREKVLPNITTVNRNPNNDQAKQDAIRELTEIVQSMPKEKREILRDFIHLLDQVAENESTTKMNNKNLAIVLGSRLLPIDENSAIHALMQTMDQNSLAKFILDLDKEQKQFIFGP